MSTSTRYRAPSFRSLWWALSILVLLGSMLSMVVSAMVLPDAGGGAVAIALFAVVAVVYFIAGGVAWLRRPANAIGVLLVWGGVALTAANLANAPVAALAALGDVFATAVLAVIVHLLLAFPTGRLNGAVPRVLAGAAYAIAILVPLPSLVLGTGAEAVAIVQSAAGLVLMIATAALLAVRLRGADRRARRVLLPLYTYGIVAVPALVALPSLLPSDQAVLRAGLQLLLLLGVPIAFLIGVLAGGFAATRELADLGERLSTTTPGDGSLSDAVAETLGDPSLRVLLRSGEGLVDEDGDPARVSAHPDRGVVDVDVDGRTVGAIEYDRRSEIDEARVRRAGRIIAVAIDRARLSAELRQSRREVMASRIRIVEAADRERFRIARDLHDGLQARLVLLGVEAQQIAHAGEVSAEVAEAATALRRRIDDAAGDLRRLVHDVLPMPLMEGGVIPAVEDLVDRMPIPTTLSAHVEPGALPDATGTTAYFVVAETLANAIKHADAERATVTLSQDGPTLHITVVDDGAGGADANGRGLRGLADRVDAIGGAWFLSSPAGGGTRVEVRLPCAS
ncbi:sensor histidine kinase [Microbacterium xanthum]|uniref:sensor histidine kinase n=1 Tax=Microbacterium xanthum TaxID=3079794 RepID=UPI002AD42416|nr:histidine kinase [Microbacterium sp. KSW-48]MDZ8172295.1 histidine kinase [Microbacterium sp. KSW-48]